MRLSALISRNPLQPLHIWLLAFTLTGALGCVELGPAPDPGDDPGAVQAALVTDSGLVTYADPSGIIEVFPDDPIAYRWGLVNNGGSQWLSGMQLEPVTSTVLVDTNPIRVPALAVDESADITASGTAPHTPGLYVEHWRLVDSRGTAFSLTGVNTADHELVIQVRVLTP